LLEVRPGTPPEYVAAIERGWRKVLTPPGGRDA
jgi:hypothetical protein